MKARDAVSLVERADVGRGLPAVGSGMPLLDVLPRLLDSPEHKLAVTGEEGKTLGIISETSLLEALSYQIAARFDCSVIEMECAQGDYSASHIARAVEDSDVHLVDMLTNPAADGRVRVTLRVSCENPEATVHSLERYGYEIVSVTSRDNAPPILSFERLLELQTLMNV